MLNRILINPLTFAADKAILQGEVALQELDERVCVPEMAETNRKIAYQITGGIDVLQRPFLDLSVSGDLKLHCQRCLLPTDFQLNENVRIVLFSDEETLDNAMVSDESLEGMLLDEELDMLTLVEDQILMALPISPKHNDCDDAHLDKVNQGKPNPFAVLSGLKKG
ncbi:MAG: YceD family protein [Alysiella sp.]|uniref:YceD family protein n=1 Tax=Alysiella sp. TaxID=1872483 RepID=UPI0026DBFB4A|nr:YceD family protein [Alysiella sp.]MDO4433016.1 YceD family protein [Alysiella sp.]